MGPLAIKSVLSLDLRRFVATVKITLCDCEAKAIDFLQVLLRPSFVVTIDHALSRREAI